MIDKNGKLFGKLSVVDLVILLVFLIAIGGFVYKLTSGDETIVIKNDTPIQMVFETRSVRQASVDAVQVGQSVYEQYGDYIGKVVSISTEPAHTLAANGDGTQTYAETENRYNLYITLDCSGKVNETGFYINGSKRFARGNNVNLESTTFSTTSFVSEIE